jgi:hypothetical protein
VVGVNAGSSRTGGAGVGGSRTVEAIVGINSVYHTTEVFSKGLHDAPVGRGDMVKMSRFDVET